MERLIKKNLVLFITLGWAFIELLIIVFRKC